MLGRACGDFAWPRNTPASMADLFRRALASDIAPVDRITVLRADFGGNIVLCSSPEAVEQFDDVVFATRGSADGGIVYEPHHAVAVLNADCPVVGIYDYVHKRLAVLHAGFRCLRGPHGSIVRRLVLEHGFSPINSRVLVLGGIGNCCYGAEHHPEIETCGNGRAIRGPRQGQRSIDLRSLIVSELYELALRWNGVWNGVEIDYTCSGCLGRRIGEPGPQYHSNVWDGPNAGRNATLVWFE